MAKIAKIALMADIKEYKKSMAEAKKTMLDMSGMQLDPKLSADFGKKLNEDLSKAVTGLQSKLSETETALKKLGEAGASAYDNEEALGLIKSHADYNSKLKETKQLITDINREKEKAPKEESGGGSGGGSSSGMASKGLRAGGRAMAAVGLGVGMGALYQRGQSLAGADIGTRSLAGAGLGDERSKFGFSRMERLSSAGGMADALGRSSTEEELTSLVNKGEQIERGTGFSQANQAQFMKSARKGGVEDQQGLLAMAIGEATAAGLEGSSLTEYLSSMTGYMEQMSKGVDINEGSLNSFSSSLASLPFFQNNPERIFDAINKLDSAFTGGDRFQQAQAVQSIRQAGGPGLGVADVEMRRSMGLFGEMDEKTMSILSKEKGGESFSRAMGTSGKDILEKDFASIMKMTEGQDIGQRVSMFANMKDMTAAEAAPIVANLIENKGKLGDKAMEDFKNGRKSPEERSADVMATASGKILNAGSIIDEAMNKMAIAFTESAAKLITGLDDLGVDLATLTGAITALTMVQGLGLLKGGGGGGLLGGVGGKAGKGLGRLATALSKGGPKGLMTALTRMVSPAMKMAGGAAAVAGAGYAGYKVGEMIEPTVTEGLDKYTTGKTDEGFEGNIVEQLFFKLDKLFGGETSSNFIKNQEALDKFNSKGAYQDDGGVPYKLKPTSAIEKTLFGMPEETNIPMARDANAATKDLFGNDFIGEESGGAPMSEITSSIKGGASGTIQAIVELGDRIVAGGVQQQKSSSPSMGKRPNYPTNGRAR